MLPYLRNSSYNHHHTFPLIDHIFASILNQSVHKKSHLHQQCLKTISILLSIITWVSVSKPFVFVCSISEKKNTQHRDERKNKFIGNRCMAELCFAWPAFKLVLLCVKLNNLYILYSIFFPKKGQCIFFVNVPIAAFLLSYMFGFNFLYTIWSSTDLPIVVIIYFNL